MLDRKTEQMLKVANMLTAEDLELLRGTTPPSVGEVVSPVEPMAEEDPPEASIQGGSPGLPAGERERMRTRESKISTACVGNERPKHNWWPVGTELIGHMGSEAFTATVVENPRVKSGRSLMITSGPASGTVCKTPTRAAIEATEAYRQANNLGRGGGVTNGWTFWKPRT